MDFLNLGWPEILFILVLAFIILGPSRITEVGRKLGESFRKLSRNAVFRDVVQTTDEIRNYPRKIINEAMLDQPLRLDERVMNSKAGEVKTADGGNAEDVEEVPPIPGP